MARCRRDQLADLSLELLHALPFVAGQTTTFTAVDLGLADPLADRFGADAQLASGVGHRSVAITTLGGRLGDQPDGALPDLWVDTAAGTGAACCRVVP